MRNLKMFIRVLGEKFGIFAYTRPQQHNLIQSKTALPAKYNNLLLPLPIHTHSQRVKKIKISPQPQTFIKEDTFNVAVFSSQEIKRGDNVEVGFELETKPVVYKGKNNFLLHDYKGNFSVTGIHANSEDREIKVLADKIVGEERQLVVVMKKLYDYVVSSLVYGDQTAGLYSYKDALTRAYVDCGGFCMLLSSLLGVFHIPHYLAVGYLVGWSKDKKLSQHVWLEAVMPDGSIFPLDPSEDKRRRTGQSSRWGGFGYVGSDRVVFSYGHDIEILVKGKKIVEPLIQHPIILR